MASRPERVLCSNVEVPGATEEPGEIRGEQAHELPGCRRIACLRRFEQRVERRSVANSKPANSAVENVLMPLEQLNARQP